MRILFVDDDPARLPALWSLLMSGGIKADVTYRESAEAVTEGDLVDHDVVFLDHDLCPSHYPSPIPCPETVEGTCPHGTGFAVVSRFLEKPPAPHRRFVVHSLSARAPAMVTRLRKEGHRVAGIPIDVWQASDARDALYRILRGA